MSNGSPDLGLGFSPMVIKANSASGSSQRRMSQAEAIRSTPMFSQVTHFMIYLRVFRLIFRARADQVLNGRSLALLLVDTASRNPVNRLSIFLAFSIGLSRSYLPAH